MKEENNAMEERFKNTIESKNWGACFECCDYENMMEETKDFIRNEIHLAEESLVGRVREEIVQYCKDNVNEMSERTFREIYDLLDLPSLAPKPKGDK